MTTQQQPPAPVQPAFVPRNGFGITALVLAIIGLVFGLIPFTGFIAIILGALALLFGLLGVGRARSGIATNKTMSIIGAALGAAALALGIYGMVVVFNAVSEVGEELDRVGANLDEYSKYVDALDVNDAKYLEKVEACGK